MDSTRLEPPLLSKNSFVSAVKTNDGPTRASTAKPAGAFLIVKSLLFLVFSFIRMSFCIRDFQSQRVFGLSVT